MAQVVRTVNDLIVNSLYLTGELGVGENPDNFMLSTGLEIVNALLDTLSADSIYIPYLTTIDFTMVANQGEYSISDIIPADINADRVIDLSFANYRVQTIIYPVKIISKAEFSGVVRLTDLVARPGFVFLNKQPTESLITFYPKPDQPYPATIQFKLMLDKLEAQEELTNLPPFYYQFLKYAMAREFLAYYPSANWSDRSESDYQRMYAKITSVNETDVTIRPSVILDAPQPFYWPNILAY